MNMIQIKSDLAALDCPAVALATICGISKSRLSEILSGQYQPVNGEIPQIETALAEMKTLRDEYPGLPIDFSDGVRIRQLFESRRQSPAREIGNIIRELKLPFSAFVRLQFEDPIVNLADAYKVLNGVGADPAHTRVLLRLAHHLQEFTKSFPEPNWADVFAIKSTLKRWNEIERARAK